MARKTSKMSIRAFYSSKEERNKVFKRNGFIGVTLSSSFKWEWHTEKYIPEEVVMLQTASYINF